MSTITRVSGTSAAQALIETLQTKYGNLLFHQSGGCCDGSAPMCYPRNEFLVGDADVLLGEVFGVPFYMSESQFAYWEHTHLTLDVVAGNGGQFSLDNGTGKRFLIRSRLYSEDEWQKLNKIPVRSAV